MGALRSLLRRLRSRRLAVGLIAAVVGYSLVATLVPQVSGGGRAVGEWQLTHPWLAPLTRMFGLHIAFSSPLFLAVAVLLGASTAACAWERARASLRAMRASGRVAESELRLLSDRPTFSMPLGSSAEDPLPAMERSLRRLRFGVRRGPRVLEASSNRLGLLGSPLFHWTLTLLFVVIALGRLSRAEGLIGVPIGFRRVDAAESYRGVKAGPLYAGHSGLTLLVTDLRPFKDAVGVDRGISPYVELYQGDTLLQRQRVYPNNPLRHGSLLIHSNDYGLAAVIAIETSSGAEFLHSEPLVDFDDATPSGTAPAFFRLLDDAGARAVEVTLTVPLDRAQGRPVRVMPKRRTVALSVRAGGVDTTTTLATGEAMTLPTGHRLRLKDVVYYARLSVADDWSIYPIYALFVLAAAALSLAVLVRYRRMLVMTVSSADGRELHALISHGRGDPLFAESIENALRETATQEPSAKEESA